MVGERWSPIAGFADYEVSDQGRVRRVKTSRLLSLRPNSGEHYARVCLMSADGERHMRRVHRLVLEAFVGPAPDGMVGCHGAGGSTDNRLSNLRWDTELENARDRIRHGTQARGQSIHGVRVTQEIANEIRASVPAIRPRGLIARLCEKYSLSRGAMVAIINGTTWKEISV